MTVTCVLYLLNNDFACFDTTDINIPFCSFISTYIKDNNEEFPTHMSEKYQQLFISHMQYGS